MLDGGRYISAFPLEQETTNPIGVAAIVTAEPLNASSANQALKAAFIEGMLQATERCAHGHDGH